MAINVSLLLLLNAWWSHTSPLNQVTWLQTEQLGARFLAKVLEILSTLQHSPERHTYCSRHNVAWLSDGNAYQWCSKVFEIDRQSSFHWATPCHNTLALQHPLHNAKGIVNRPFHLIAVEIVRPTQNDGAGRASLWTVETRHTLYNSLNSNLFCLVGKTAEILQLNYAKEESSLWAKKMSPKLLVLCTLCVHLQCSSDIPVVPVTKKWYCKFPVKISVMGEFTWLKVLDLKGL